MSHELMPPHFEEESFTAMLLEYVAKINSSDIGKHVYLSDEGSFDWNSITAEESRELYRIVQETVGNAIRHGIGDDIRLVLSGDTGYALTVSNSCEIYNASDTGKGIGLRTIKARAAIIGANISIARDNGVFSVTISQSKK